VDEAPDSWEQHLSPCSLSSENPEGLTAKGGTLGLQAARKNHCRATKKQARRARVAGSLDGDSVIGQSRLTQGSQKQALWEPRTSGTQGLENMQVKPGPVQKPSQGPSKCQKLSGSTPGGGQAKRSRTTGQLSHATATQEGVWMAIVYEGYVDAQVSIDDSTNIQQAIGQLVDELSEERFTPRLINMFWTNGAAVVVCQDEDIGDWLASHIPTLRAWEDSRLKMVGLDALPTYKRVVAWFPGPVEDTLCYLQRLRRLNRGLDTDKWRVYECTEEPHGVHLPSLWTLSLLRHWRG